MSPKKPDETARRQALLGKLRNEYILSHDGISPAMMAGLEMPPAAWLNARLKEMGESWTVKESLPKPGQKQRLAVSEAPPLTTPSTTTEKHKTTDRVSAVVNPAPDTVSVSVNRAGAKSQPFVDPKNKMNWRKHLRVGMTADEVRRLFGEPDRITTGGAMQIWVYGSGSITLDEGRIHGWSEPRD